ncbi:VOC family protein [Phenylobacterium sp. LjRoot225]|uniref:VOC family protein n=1 Tax=Phenylobacterium sp. LjRoot225 TaxID=3342285 RepID=UPI003ECCBFCF
MFLERHYQNAYVTPDIDRAIETMRRLHGVTDVLQTEATTEVWTPNGSGPNVTKLAFIWVGNLQYELIQPISGPSDLYSAAVDPDKLLVFHHIAMRVAGDYDEFRASLDKQGRSVVIEGHTPSGLKFCYVDARDTLGHYLEYVWAPDAMWAHLDPKGVTNA